MNEEPLQEEQDEPPQDPRRRLLADLTPQQRYALYAVLVVCVVLVFYMESLTH